MSNSTNTRVLAEIAIGVALDLDPAAAYVHLTSNNTIAGTQWDKFPDTKGVPLVADMSSDLLWRAFDANRFHLIYAGAQKNMGPAGVCLVIIREEWDSSAESSDCFACTVRTSS